MARNLKNVTVTLEPDTARWARIEAARRDTSVSRMIGEMLQSEMEARSAYDASMERYLGAAAAGHRERQPHLPSREELHDRPGLR